MSPQSAKENEPLTRREPGLERWLRSPGRRRLLIVAGVALLSGINTLFVVDTLSAFEGPLEGPFEPWRVFIRRFFDYAWWGLLVEPIAFIGARVGRIVRAWPIQVLIHVGMAIVIANAVRMAQSDLAPRIFPSSFLAEPGRPGRGPGEARPARERGERGERGERSERRGAESRPGEGRESDTPPTSRWRSRAELARRMSTNRRLEVGMLAYAALLALGSSVRSFLSQRDQERLSEELLLRAARLESELAGARLASLENQLQPHFLFNALHSVGGLVRSGEQETAVATLAALGSLLRTSLDQDGADQVPLHEEIDLVEGYLDIERIRLGERLETTIELERGTANASVPTLLLLPLVENAVRYAIAPRTEGGSLLVRAWREESFVFIEVTDDGPGFPEVVIERGEGPEDGRKHIGIANTRARLSTVYGDEARLTLENRVEGGARIEIRIPVIGENQEVAR